MPRCPLGHESASSDYCDNCGRRMDGPPEAQPAARATRSSTSAPSGGSGGGSGAGEAAVGQAEVGPPEQSEICPVCQTPRSGRYCEVDRFDFVTGMPAGPLPGYEPASGHSAGLTAPAASTQGATTQGGTAAGATTAGATAAGATAAGATAAGGTTLRDTDSGIAGASPGTANGAVWSAVAAADRAYFDQVITEGGPGAAGIPFPPYCPTRRFQLGQARPGEEKQIGRQSKSRGLNPDIDLTGPPTDPGISRLHAVLIGQPDGCWAVIDPGSANGILVNGRDIPAGAEVPLHDGDRINLGAWTVITISREPR
jgi:hypothetical protein